MNTSALLALLVTAPRLHGPFLEYQDSPQIQANFSSQEISKSSVRQRERQTNALRSIYLMPATAQIGDDVDLL
jgi:hypothetical protein